MNAAAVSENNNSNHLRPREVSAFEVLSSVFSECCANLERQPRFEFRDMCTIISPSLLSALHDTSFSSCPFCSDTLLTPNSSIMTWMSQVRLIFLGHLIETKARAATKRKARFDLFPSFRFLFSWWIALFLLVRHDACMKLLRRVQV